LTQIAIDGPASSGKSSVGARVASTLTLGFLDTGLLYRAVTRAALGAGFSCAALERKGGLNATEHGRLIQLARLVDVDLQHGDAVVTVDGTHFASGELEGEEVERAVAAVAALPEVREALRSVQRVIAVRGGVVLAGRDIGTVVYPEARHKFFLDASVETRALRRAVQRGFAQDSEDHREIVRRLSARDLEDRTRAVAPLRAAADAAIILTDALSLEQVVQRIVESVRSSSNVA
jgi:cytidylate kinase